MAFTVQEIHKFKVGSREYESREDADRAAEILSAIDSVEALLPSGIGADPGDCFGNGEFYLQHTSMAVAKYQNELGKLLHQFAPDLGKMFAQNPRGFVQRVADDSDSLFSGAIWRLARIDEAAREWGQAGFAEYPREGAREIESATLVEALPAPKAEVDPFA
jgi:hypothetical protein